MLLQVSLNCFLSYQWAEFICKLVVLNTFFQVSLKLILASGKSAEFIFPLITSVGEVTEYVYDNWPEGMYQYQYSQYIISGSMFVQGLISHG